MKPLLLILSIILFSLTTQAEENPYIITNQVVKKKFLAPAEAAALKAAKKLQKLLKKEKLSKSEKQAKEELEKIINIYKYWKNYSDTLVELSTETNKTKRRILLLPFTTTFLTEYKTLTGKDSPRPLFNVKKKLQLQEQTTNQENEVKAEPELPPHMR